MKRQDFLFILKLVFSWRIVLILFLIIALNYVPLQKNFLGGGMGNYLRNPYLWSWGNFDGEHYLSIAQRGYQPLTYFFFPLFPVLVSIFQLSLKDGLFSYLLSGLFVSHVSLILALIGLYKLIRLDFKKNVATNAIYLLLLFPTSFYFGSVYTESLFLALAVWSFLFARKRKWFWVGILGGLAALTRIIGLVLLPALFFEFAGKEKGKNKLKSKKFVWLGLIPLFLVGYMVFLKSETGDPLEFFNTVSIFGEQRSSSLILFPQVFYRYIFKILPSLNYSYLPSALVSWFEFIVASLFLGLSVLSFKKLRLSYALFLTLGFLVPTFSGSFSSLPRYVLVLFPVYILLSTYLVKFSKISRILIYSVLFILLGIFTTMFVRGYFVA